MKPSKFDAVGLRVRVYLEDDAEWHDGMVEEYHPRRGYHIQLFDGQDIWFEHFDENVEFEKEYDVEGDLDATNGKTIETQMSFHDDELAFLQDAENVLDGADRAGDDQVDEEYGTGMLVPDYNTHQDYNQRAIRADLPTLPARGVLLSGSVLGAAGLSSPDEDAADGELFFKVLFVEGGSQPAMFRCKTPIFTSSPVPNTLANPQWRDGRFQFDMIMPVDAAQDAKSPYGFKIQGEIIIAVYLSGSSGGNHFLGQASFQLKDVVETGTVEYFLAGYEGRSVTGAHTILSRTGDITGEIDLQLNIAWKSLRVASGTVTASQSKLAGLPPRPVFATAGASRSGSASRAGSRAQTTGRDGSAPRQRPVSGTSTTNKGLLPPPRKIVSGLLRKQREDQARIARENKKLQQTLEQHANRNRAGAKLPVATAYGGAAGSSGASTAPAGVARPLSATASVGAGNKRLSAAADAKDTADGRDSSRNPPRGASAGSKAAQDSGAVLDGLVRMYNDLKRSTALEDQELARLRLKVGKLKVSVKQAEMSVDRIRSEGGVNDSLSRSSLRGSLRNSGEGNLRDRDSPAISTASPKDTPPRDSARSQSQAKGERGDVARVGAHAYIPFFEPLSEAQLKALDIHDGEYKSLAEEHTVLQAVRRGLLDRLATAKAACNSAGVKQLSARDRLEMIRRRVDYYRDIAGKLAIGVVLQLEDGAALGAKRGATVDEDSRHGDYLLFDRLREVKQEYATEFALHEASMHTIAQDNALEELRAVRDLLAGKCATLDASVRGLKQENDSIHQQVREALSAHRELDIDAYVQRLRQERSLQRGGGNRRGPALSDAAEERLRAAGDGLAAVDRQLRGVKERQEERRLSRTTPAAAADLPVGRMVELDG